MQAALNGEALSLLNRAGIDLPQTLVPSHSNEGLLKATWSGAMPLRPGSLGWCAQLIPSHALSHRPM